LSDKTTIRFPIARRKTYELVADRLTEEISSRVLQPGDLLPPERELVASFGVGRSSIREALRMLESRGLIEDRANGTFAVAQLTNPLNQSLNLLLEADEADVAELFEIRRILEGESAALAAARRTRPQLDRMAEAIDAMVNGLSSEEEFIAADLRFHLNVAEATRNRVAIHLMDAIRGLLQRALSSSYHVAGSPARAIEMHRLILEAIRDRRPDLARERMQEHVESVERDIRGRARRNGKERRARG
jgi:GntR family transcriptional regulator, transcriptional repressor for pyruvate dehydrogenase complex